MTSSTGFIVTFLVLLRIVTVIFQILNPILVLRYDWNELLHSFVRCFPCFGLLLPNDLVPCRRSPTWTTKVNVHWRSQEIRSINEDRKKIRIFQKIFLFGFSEIKKSKKYFEIYEFGCSLVQLFHPLFITSWKNKKSWIPPYHVHCYTLVTPPTRPTNRSCTPTHNATYKTVINQNKIGFSLLKSSQVSAVN